jgi:hypothetical protein
MDAVLLGQKAKYQGCLRRVLAPLLKTIPLSFEGEGD